MVHSKRHRVAVVYGGQSFEHEVSMLSARGVMQNINPALFDVIPVKITQEGSWIWRDESVFKLNAPYDNTAQLSQSWETLTDETPQQITSRAAHRELMEFASHDIDIVFPLIHGTKGEDGCIQGLLEMAGIPYVGCNVLASALGMDKHIAKDLVAAAGLPVAPYQVVKKYTWQKSPETVLDQAKKLGDTLFVKPVNAGSSVGITKVSISSQLRVAIDEAFLYDTKILIEKAINAREIELSVLENEVYGELPRVSVAGEIVPQHEFYSYEAKYLDPNGALLLIPAEIQSEQLRLLQDYAQRAFMTLECEGMARVDFFIDKVTGECYFNEINTIPGFTPISMYPKLWEASGLSYQELITELLNLALARAERKKLLHHQAVKGQMLAGALQK